MLSLLVVGCSEKATVEGQPSEIEPAYKVLFSYSGKGRKFGDILVPSFSRATPVETREVVLRAIAAKEGLDDVSLYSSEEAYKANVSASFQKSHPDALQNGFLGMLREGKFTAGETLFP